MISYVRSYNLRKEETLKQKEEKIEANNLTAIEKSIKRKERRS